MRPKQPRKPVWFGWGFGARANAEGTVTFLYTYRNRANAKRWFTLGTYPSMSLAAAREEHRQAQSLVKAGKDPFDEAEQVQTLALAAEAALLQPTAPTVRNVFDHWQRTALKCVRNRNGQKMSGYKDDGAAIALQFRKHVFPKFGGMPIRDMRRSMVIDLLDDTKAQGLLSTAGHMFTNLKAFFKFAVLHEYVDRNPLAEAEKRSVVGKANTGDRYLEDWEIARLQRRLPMVNLHVVTQLALRFVLATGARPEEVASMPKSELTDDGKLWLVPAARYKIGAEHAVPLSAHAQLILEQAAQFNEGSPFVFPSPVDIKRQIDRHSMSKAIGRKLGIAKPSREDPDNGELGLAKFVTHDLRRSVQTGMARIGIAESIADRVLGHTPKAAGRMATVYNRHEYLDERRAALAKWGEHLDSLA